MSEQEQQQQEPVSISLQDIATVVQLIDVVSRRGGIEGRELAGVGMLRNKLEACSFSRTHQQKVKHLKVVVPGADAPADVPS